MKKILSVVVAVFIIATITAVSAFAAYPGSPDWDHPLPTNGELLQGELIGTAGWGGNEAAAYPAAWDGDPDTFFDPEGVGEAYYTGVKLDQEYVLTEIRIIPRSGQEARWVGATIQGSNDGENWTNIFENLDELAALDYQIITAFENNDGYSYYRYVNNTNHGDVGDIELYGNPKAAPEVIEVVDEVIPDEPAAEPTVEAPVTAAPTAPQTGDSFMAFVTALVIAIIATFVICRRKITSR